MLRQFRSVTVGYSHYMDKRLTDIRFYINHDWNNCVVGRYHTSTIKDVCEVGGYIVSAGDSDRLMGVWTQTGIFVSGYQLIGAPFILHPLDGTRFLAVMFGREIQLWDIHYGCLDLRHKPDIKYPKAFFSVWDYLIIKSLEPKQLSIGW